MANTRQRLWKAERLSVSLAVAITLLSAFSAFEIESATAIPQPAAEYYGTASLQGDAAEPGTNISAFDPSGIKCGTYITKTAGKFGLASCNGDDTDTPTDEGAAFGDNVAFRINGTLAYVTDGNTSWVSGNFTSITLLGLKNDSPYLYGCQNSSLAEDGNGSDVSVDLPSCSYDRNDNISSLNFSVAGQTNSSLINCFIIANKNLTCDNPLRDGNGVNMVKIEAEDPATLKWSINLTVNVTPVNDSPAFAYNLTTQFGSDGTQFIYDINCTDPDGDAVYYYDNATFFEIDSITGLINFTPSQSDAGNHSIKITCDDETLSATGNFTLVISDVNNPPLLDQIGNLQARSGFLFTKRLSASDPDNDSLTFSDNTTLFDIKTSGNSTGLINFTPSESQMGNYSISITVSDGKLSDYEVINFSVRIGAFCGDRLCSSGESCLICQADCGKCPSGVGTGTGAAGQGVGAAAAQAAAAAVARRAVVRCLEQWRCEEWQECVDSVQTRLCRDVNNCRTTLNKPQERRECKLEMPAQAPSCRDGVKNQNEEGVDCGGACNPCLRKVFAALPISKIAIPFEKLGKQLPISLILVIMLLSSNVIIADQVHLRRIRKLPLKVYKEKIRKYRPIRKLIYKALINTLFITLIVSIYYYAFSNCPECLRRYFWVPIFAVAAVPFVVASLLRWLEFTEYKKSMRERRLKNTHEQQIRQLLRLETKLSLETEQELIRRIKAYDAKNPENAFISLLGKIKNLAEAHSKKLAGEPFGEALVELLENSAKDKELAKASKGDVELKQLTLDIKALLKALRQQEENAEAEKNFTESVENVAGDMALIQVIAANKHLSSTYNKLVDVYSEAINRRKESEQALKEELEAEGQLLKEFAKIFDNRELADKNSTDGDWVRVYNLLVELNSHYKKKQEQGNSE